MARPIRVVRGIRGEPVVEAVPPRDGGQRMQDMVPWANEMDGLAQRVGVSRLDIAPSAPILPIMKQAQRVSTVEVVEVALRLRLAPRPVHVAQHLGVHGVVRRGVPGRDHGVPMAGTPQSATRWIGKI